MDELHQQRLDTHLRPEDVAFRRVKEPLQVETVLGILAEVFDVEIDAFRQRRRDSVLRGWRLGFCAGMRG